MIYVILMMSWAGCGPGRRSAVPPVNSIWPVPRVIIVKQGVGPGPSPTHDLLQSEGLHYNLHQTDLVKFFSSITLLYLADERISSLARHRRLKELIQRQTEEIRHIKQSAGCLFSALHLNCFFTDAVKHTAWTVTEPFDFLVSSRRTNPVATDHSHLREFLRLSRQQRFSYRFYTPILASSLLLDAYPPDMHRESPSSGITGWQLTSFRFRPRDRFWESIPGDVLFRVDRRTTQGSSGSAVSVPSHPR